MELIDELEEEIDKLKDNEYGIRVIKTKYRGILTTSIVIPQEIINKEISEMPIEFQLIIDTNSLKLIPKLYCVSPFCYPHFADGRDLFYELRSSKNPEKYYWLSNLLSDILQFIKINYEKGGIYFFGNYYLGSKYDLRLLQKGCENILNVRENLIINGKSLKINRVLVLSDVYFLLFEQEKWYKNNLTLLFWSSISNIQKIQKVKDSKTIILQWTQKEKETYPMSLTLPQRESFIERLLEKMNHFGMIYDITKMENNKNETKKIFKKGIDISQSQNIKLINDYNRQELEKNNGQELEKKKNNEEEEEEEYEEEEEEEDDEEEDIKDNVQQNVAIDVNQNQNQKENNNAINNQMEQNEENKDKNKEIYKNENKEVTNQNKNDDDDDFIEVSENNKKEIKNENNDKDEVKEENDNKKEKKEEKQEINVNINIENNEEDEKEEEVKKDEEKHE